MHSLCNTQLRDEEVVEIAEALLRNTTGTYSGVSAILFAVIRVCIICCSMCIARIVVLERSVHLLPGCL
jgi:hypothetical protein